MPNFTDEGAQILQALGQGLGGGLLIILTMIMAGVIVNKVLTPYDPVEEATSILRRNAQ